MGKNLNSDGQQFHQYRQNEQSPMLTGAVVVVMVW